jgi:hypothetical protein
MGINKRKATVRNCCEWRKTVLEAKFHNKLQHLRRRRRNALKYMTYAYV